VEFTRTTLAKFFITFTRPPDEDTGIDYRIDPYAYIEALRKQWQHGNIGRVFQPL
jgi:hypothetical protein